jgi:hypothetical protein
MRTFVWLSGVATAVLLVSPASTWTQQNDPQSQVQPTTAPQQESLAETARKAREQRKEAPKSVKTFTNDNLPSEGGISTVGENAGTASTAASTSPAAQQQGSPGGTPNDEKSWRARFGELHHKLDQDQANLEVMQRELGVLNTQYYSDPTKTMQQELTRSDINDKTSDIDKAQAQVDADKQAIADAEDALRKSGGDPGWSR